MKKIEDCVNEEVKSFRDDIRVIDGIQWLPVSDVKVHIKFAVKRAIEYTIDETVGWLLRD